MSCLAAEGTASSMMIASTPLAISTLQHRRDEGKSCRGNLPRVPGVRKGKRTMKSRDVPRLEARVEPSLPDVLDLLLPPSRSRLSEVDDMLDLV